jgi:hypothetical protein
LSRRKGEQADLSVLRTEDVPLEDVSGVCLRREAGGDMGLVAFGDRTSVAAWVQLPRLGDLVPGDAVVRADVIWKLPRVDGKPEGLALTRNGRAIVALDTRKARDNLVLLEPPIADGRPA